MASRNRRSAAKRCTRPGSDERAVSQKWRCLAVTTGRAMTCRISSDLGVHRSRMLEHFEKEWTRGRFPPQSAIELLLVQLPRDLAEELRVATSVASAEVSPRDRRAR